MKRALAAIGLHGAVAVGAAETTSHGRFDQIAVYQPEGAAQQFVMLLSGSAGWDASTAATAQTLADRGALVAGIDTAALLAKLDAERDACTFPDGDFENLSHHLQAFYKLPTYLAPIIAGQGSGASLAYALVAQAPSTTFGGLLTSGFCPQLPLHKPLCKGAGIHFKTTPPPASAALARSAVGAKPMLTLLPAAQLPVAWQALASGASACSPGTARRFVAQVGQATWVASIDGNPPLAAAYAELALHNNATVAPPPSDLADLPIVEVPVEAAGPRFAVLVSGDGGWAGIDKELGAALAARGIPVAGIDSLRYFWTPRTPAGLAGDLDRVIAYYAHHWQRSEVLLIGYSQGADVLPFAINRLAPATREKVKLHALLSLGQKAAFEFHVSNWLGPSGEEPILPEAAKLDAADTLCVYGERETDALCPELKPGHAQVQALPGGHHYDGDYAGLADLILKHAPPTR